jgi:serine/threonine protein kinase
LTDRQDLKILDFGLSSLFQKSSSHSPLGTLAYMPPEAFTGEYDFRSDLFSLGVLFYEVLSGRLPYTKPLSSLRQKIETPPPLSKICPELPSYFADLIDRLLALNPSRRPPSVLSMIKFLNQHVETPYEILEEETSETILEKVPWVGRQAETEAFWEALEKSQRFGHPAFFQLSGPTGVGRSRFLEEMKWKLQLEGFLYLSFKSPEAEGWMGTVAGHLGITPRPPQEEFTSFIRRLLSSPSKTKITLAFTDLQDWPPSSLKALLLFLSMARRTRSSLILLLEWNEDRIEAALKAFLSSLPTGPETTSLRLKDLSIEESEQLIEQATLDAPLPESLSHEIALGSGGRPLLILEALRNFLGKKEKDLLEEPFSIPRSLGEVAAEHARSLPLPLQKILALIASHPYPIPFSEALELSKSSKEELERMTHTLEQKGITRPLDRARPLLVMSHPSLRFVYLQALSPEILKEANTQWIRLLIQKFGDQPTANPTAVVVADHRRR